MNIHQTVIISMAPQGCGKSKTLEILRLNDVNNEIISDYNDVVCIDVDRYIMQDPKFQSALQQKMPVDEIYRTLREQIYDKMSDQCLDEALQKGQSVIWETTGAWYPEYGLNPDSDLPLWVVNDYINGKFKQSQSGLSPKIVVFRPIVDYNTARTRAIYRADTTGQPIADGSRHENQFLRNQINFDLIIQQKQQLGIAKIIQFNNDESQLFKEIY